MTVAEFDRLEAGVLPQQMEDKWFAFFEEPWLHIHRSWTGFCIYQIRIDSNAESARIAEVVVNRDASQYASTSEELDRLQLRALLTLFAGRDSVDAWRTYMAGLKSQNSLHDKAGLK